MGIDKVTKQWIRNHSDELAVANGCYFDVDAAEHVKQFCERFLSTQQSGRVQPIKLLAWQWHNVVAPIFGWRRADGSRRFTQAYISVAKKNGKTLLLAALTLYMLVVSGGNCASVATERDQAAQIYQEAAGMVRANPDLSAILKLVETQKTIAFPQRNCNYKALSAEADSKEGANLAFYCYDELHAAKNRKLFDALRYAGKAIKFKTGQAPLQVYITTAGYDRESICYEQYDYAKRVADGTIEDDSYYSFIAEAGPDDDWTSEKTWQLANPSYGITLDPEEFRREFNEAKASPAKEASFRRYCLNQWTQASSRWITHEVWDNNNGTINPADYKGRECIGALDLASTEDITAFVLLFRNDKGGFDVLPFFWVPADNIADRSKRHRVSYEAWKKQGCLETTEGNVTDFDYIRQRINELAKVYNIKEIAFDDWNATQLTTQLMGDGIKCIKAGKDSKSMSEPAKEFYKMLLAGKINHGGNPVLKWMAGNVEAKFDDKENIVKLGKPGGSKSGPGKVDGILAIVMGMQRALLHGEGSGVSVYESRGMEII